ncbi:transposase [Okeania sp. KiyG1]|uniref:transposase n=1 Tax=Okeania sp. KiyG1 TaxID=2720165 RepID=UPI001992B77D|nr:transposase [Okeania sp. KiyG1]GGA32175.1 hypothetical protein CYANOKiyG1_48900 [Okeania sp. KiyG1]
MSSFQEGVPLQAYQKFEAKLSRLQYLNRHKQVGSANWRKAQLKIARLHRKVANIRQDALHKLTTYLAKNHNPPPSPPGRGARGVGEDLNVRGILANHKLAKSIANQGFYEFHQTAYSAFQMSEPQKCKM